MESPKVKISIELFVSTDLVSHHLISGVFSG